MASKKRTAYLHVLADAGTIVNDLDVQTVQHVLWAHSRHHQQLGTLKGTRRNDYFLGSVDLVPEPTRVNQHTRGPLVIVEHNLLGQRRREDYEVRPPGRQVGLQIGCLGRLPNVLVVPDWSESVGRAVESAVLKPDLRGDADGGESLL